MNVALRALGWAIRFFWIITLCFAVTCVYSASLISVELEDPVPLLDASGFGATLPITLANNGYYSIADLNIATTIKDAQNRSLSQTVSHVATIQPQDRITILHNLSFDPSTILAQPDHLFNDSELTLQGTIRLSYAGLVPFGFETNTSLPWGAPLSDFVVGTPEYAAYDVTNQRMTAPISFQNHSPYINVTGTIHVEVFNSRNQLIGEDTIPVNVPSNTPYNGEAELIIRSAQVTQSGEIHIYIETDTFHYGPLVANYG